ncbi:MAG: glycosyltransferase family 4 protein [Candidatus Methanoperedens sp.]
MKACIVCYGFREDNIRLQPWRYISEIASGLIHNNIDVTIITDGNLENEGINGIPVVHFQKLRSLPFVPNWKLISLIRAENPDVIFWSVGPIDYLYMSTFKRTDVPLIGLFTGPLYSLSEITRLGIKEMAANFGILSVTLVYASLPSFFVRGLANSPYFKKVFVMSKKNRHVLESIGVQKNKIVHVPAGIDKYDLIKPDDCDSIISKYGLNESSFNVLYFGSPASIRGIDSLIRAVSMVVKEYPNVRLLILSRRRGENLDNEEMFVRNLIMELEIDDNVQIISGFLDREEVKKFIAFCDMVALPFRIVPSDVPTSILESMAMGKAVISTNVDGIPELLEDGRGLIVEPNSDEELVQKITLCITNHDMLHSISEKSVAYMQTYPGWDEVTKKVIYEIAGFVSIEMKKEAAS